MAGVVLCFRVSHELVIKVSVRTRVSSESSAVEGSTSNLKSHIVVGRIQFPDS